MQLLPWATLAITLAALPLTSAIPIAGYIQPNDLLPSVGDLRPSTRVSLDHGAQYAYVLKSGNFSFPEVSPGLHTLQVLCSSHKFPELAIIVPPLETSSESIDSTPVSSDAVTESPSPASLDQQPQQPFVLIHSPSFSLPFSHLSPPPQNASLPHPVSLSPVLKNDFYTPPGSFQALAMLKNPMVLLMGGSAVVMLGLPKLLASMDPEALEEAGRMMQGKNIASNGGAEQIKGGQPDVGGRQITGGATTTAAAAAVGGAAAVAMAASANGKKKGSGGGGGGAGARKKR